MTIAEIVANIDGRLAELDAELRHLDGARAALAGDAAPAAPAAPAEPRRRARRTRGAGRAAKRSGRSHETVPAGKLLTLLSGSDGMTTRELSEAANGDPGQVLTLLKEQEEAGQVRRSGVRRSTRWHAVTNEDRVAARAAELAASSRTSAA